MKPDLKRFNDLRSKDINFDFHMHTNFTDGRSSPEEMVARAVELELSAITFSEHVNRTSDWFDGFRERIQSVKSNSALRVFVGLETKINNFMGEMDVSAALIKNADLVVGVVHRYPDHNGRLIPIDDMKHLEMTQAAETEFGLALKILEAEPVDVLGHPFGVFSNFFGTFPEQMMRQLCEKAVERNKAIEINTKYLVNPETLMALLREINPLVSIGSDAHHFSEIGRHFQTIREAVEK